MNNLSAETQDLEDIVGRITDEFSQRLRNGQQPNIEDYVEQYPLAADIIRQVLSSLTLLQQSLAGEDEQPESVAPGTNATQGILGDYRLIREVGRGGMGIVYEAEQLSLARRVALKILPFAAVLDERQIRRFHNEARAAAQLKHPNIVQVFGVGCERGVHYYAMEFVDGVSLAEAIEALTNEQVAVLTGEQVESADVILSKPNGSLDCQNETDNLAVETTPAMCCPALSSQERPQFYRNVARVGLQVARALDHAHAEGVIHRDIKPSNLMINAQAKVSVTDFGLARIETDNGMTMTGDLVGTLRYMSPEQALARRTVIDHRSDIYSIGVTLYELATQQPAFPQEGRQELLRCIANVEPVAPKKLNASIPADLETIILKAIEKSPNDRYLTAKDMADDLDRFLNDELIHARRPTLTEIAFRWVKKRRRAVALMAGALVLAATTGLAALAYHQSRLSATVDQLQIQRDHATQAQQKAEAEAAKATAIKDLLLNALRSADVHEARGSDFTVRELLDEVSDNLENELVDQPEAKAAIHAVLGSAYRWLDEMDKAGEHVQVALEMRQNLFGKMHPDVVESLISQSNYVWERGDLEEAERLAREAVSISRELDLDKAQLVRSLHALGSALWPQVGSYEELEKIAEEIRAIGQEEHTEYGQLPSLMHWMAVRLCRDGNLTAAEPLAREAVELHLRLNGPNHPETGWAQSELGVILLRQKKFGEAQKCFKDNLPIFRRLFDDTRNPVFRQLNWLAVCARITGDRDTLEDVRRQVTPLLEVERSDARSWYWQSLVHLQLDEIDHAVTCCAAASRCNDFEFLLPGELQVAAIVFLASERKAKYMEVCNQAVRSMEDQVDPDSVVESTWICVLSSDLKNDTLAKALEEMQKLAPERMQEATYVRSLGALQYRLGNFQMAEQHLRRAIELSTSETSWPLEPLFAKLFLVMTEVRLGHTLEAQELLKESEAEIQQALPVSLGQQRATLELLRREVEESLATEQ